MCNNNGPGIRIRLQGWSTSCQVQRSTLSWWIPYLWAFQGYGADALMPTKDDSLPDITKWFEASWGIRSVRGLYSTGSNYSTASYCICSPTETLQGRVFGLPANIPWSPRSQVVTQVCISDWPSPACLSPKQDVKLHVDHSNQAINSTHPSICFPCSSISIWITSLQSVLFNFS